MTSSFCRRWMRILPDSQLGILRDEGRGPGCTKSIWSNFGKSNKLQGSLCTIFRYCCKIGSKKGSLSCSGLCYSSVEARCSLACTASTGYCWPQCTERMPGGKASSSVKRRKSRFQAGTDSCHKFAKKFFQESGWSYRRGSRWLKSLGNSNRLYCS